MEIQKGKIVELVYKKDNKTFTFIYNFFDIENINEEDIYKKIEEHKKIFKELKFKIYNWNYKKKFYYEAKKESDFLIEDNEDYTISQKINDTYLKYDFKGYLAVGNIKELFKFILFIKKGLQND